MNKHRLLSTLSVSIFIFLGLLQTANAGLVSTQQLLPETVSLSNLHQVRLDIQQQLVELGVEQQQATIRVAAMTDQQIIDINNKITELPAGASLGGTLLTIFIIFVITDVIGATDIFPFIKPIR